MFAVLDGEGTPEEARELERILAEDAGARAEYEAVRRFFAQLQRVPQVDPPPGVADTAVERFQLSGPPRVSSPGAESGKFLPSKQESISRVPRISYGPPAKEKTMSRNVSKLAMWIGTGVAAAAGVLIAAFIFKFPPGGENVSGTVVPAQRYRAEQIKAEDVKLGDQAVAKLMQTEAFQRIVRDPKMRTLARDPGFQALAKKPAALVALVNQADAAIALAQTSNATTAAARKAQATEILLMAPEARALVLQYSAQFRQLALEPNFAALAMDPAFANALAMSVAVNNTEVNNAAVKNSEVNSTAVNNASLNAVAK
jgi:hypothetical protein